MNLSATPAFATPNYLGHPMFIRLYREAKEAGVLWAWNEDVLVVGAHSFKHDSCAALQTSTVRLIRAIIYDASREKVPRRRVEVPQRQAAAPPVAAIPQRIWHRRSSHHLPYGKDVTEMSG